MTRLDSYKEHVEPLIGFRIVGVDVEDCEHGDPWTVLKVQRGDEKLDLVISQDPEGNGGGYLFIETNNLAFGNDPWKGENNG